MSIKSLEDLASKMPERIVLTGMMCSGKSTVGKILSQILGWNFIDTDKLIEHQAGMTIPEIFDRYGENTFRQLEKDVIKKIVSLKNTVVSTGGGAVIDRSNTELLSYRSILVYLKASPEKLKERCRSHTRPLLEKKSLNDIYRERQNVYERIPHQVNAEHQPFVVAQKILYLLPPQNPVEIPGIERIIFARGLLKIIDQYLPENPKFFLQRKVFETFRSSFEKRDVFVLPDGERAKTLKTFKRALEFLMERKVERGDAIVSVGGGAASDFTGFLSSVYKRGMRFFNIPTTLLSQVDAGIGGKNALNFGGVKNVLGTFYHPETVFIDPLTILSLSNRAYRQGFAEVVKSAIIGDPDLLSFVENNAGKLKLKNLEALKKIILETIRVKLNIVNRDFRESSGERKLLNLGHTFGHAYEVLLNLYHGEAVALGILSSIRLGERLGITEPGLYRRIFEIFEELDLTRDIHRVDLLNRDTVLKLILQDKKMKGGKIEFVLPVKPGKVIIQPLDPYMVVREVMK